MIRSRTRTAAWILALTGAVFGAAQAATAAPSPAGRPNIVLIIADDQGWGDFGFMGHEAIRTPHIDRLAEQGLVFTRGYVTAPLCCPSLASFITGLHPHRSGITWNNPPRDPGSGENRDREDSLRSRMIAFIDDVATIPRLLAQNGYTSFQAGKWWMGTYHRGGFTSGMTVPDPARPSRHGGPGLAIGRETMKPVFDFIDRAAAGGKPFFLWFAPLMPHVPHDPPERFAARHRGKTASEHVEMYRASCEWFDDVCGRLLEHLDTKGLGKNTIVLFVADNGWIQSPERENESIRSKGRPYDAGVRTPVIIRWPDRVAPRRDVATLVSGIDIAPTILEAAGVRPPREMEGLNLLAPERLRGRKTVFTANYVHDALDIDEPLANLANVIALSGPWKLIVPVGRSLYEDDPELYDIAGDPHEKTNVASKHPARVSALMKEIGRWWPESLAMYEHARGDAAGRIAIRPAQPRCATYIRKGVLHVVNVWNPPALRLTDLGGISGPVTLSLRMRGGPGGAGRVSWTTVPAPDSHDRGKLPVTIHDDDRWHDYAFELPIDGTIDGLRLVAGSSPGRVVIDRLELLGAEGTPLKSWDFD